MAYQHLLLRMEPWRCLSDVQVRMADHFASEKAAGLQLTQVRLRLLLSLGCRLPYIRDTTRHHPYASRVHATPSSASSLLSAASLNPDKCLVRSTRTSGTTLQDSGAS